MKKENVVICPPCGENVGLPTKRGANKISPILPLLPRLSAVLPPQGREITTRGFTLIELLVVVLIIGILAAVAVPQYQKAVQKAKLARLIPLVMSLYQAEEAYYLQNGKYTPDLSALDIDFSEQCAATTSETEGYYNCPDYYVGAFDGPVNAQVGLSFKTGEQKKIAYLHFFATDKTETYHKGDIVCFSRGEVARNICKTLGKGTESKHPSNWDYQYILTH